MGHGVVGEEVQAAVRGLVGDDAQVIGPTERGESKTTYLVDSPLGELVLKLTADGPGTLANQQRLVRLVEALRTRGYPAPEYIGVGQADRFVFTLQRRLPGDLLEPGPGRPPLPEHFERVLPELLAAIELQANAGDLDDPPWPDWLVETNLQGGNGYCLHETMQARPDTQHILDRVVALTTRCARGAVRDVDVVHFDLNPANILHENRRLSGIIDWNIPFTGANQGDRGFDLATLLFYTYDLSATRDQLWAQVTEISGLRWACVYLAHLCLRQVEWTVRHQPGSQEEARFLQLAQLVLDDCHDRLT